MEADVLNALETQKVYLNGGRDRDNRLLIVIQVPFSNNSYINNSSQCNSSNNSSNITIAEQQLTQQNQKQLELSLNYISSSLSDDSKKRGFVVLVDAQKCSWKLARSYIKYVAQVCDKYLESMIVLKQDVFWDKHGVDNCTKGLKKGEPIIISKLRLTKYFETTQLPDEYGGTLLYNHFQWIQNRLRIEEYKKLNEQLVNDYDNLNITLIDFKLNVISDTKKIPEFFYLKRDDLFRRIKNFSENGKRIINELSQLNSKNILTSQDLVDATELIKIFLLEFDQKRTQLTTMWTELEKTIEIARELSKLEDGVTFVTNWILGPAELLLNEQHKVGFDVQTAEDLRNKHEALELQCWDTYGFYAKLLYKINKFFEPKNNDHSTTELPIHKDLASQRDFMDFVCRSFASRLERRRNVLITSLRFFRLVSEYFDRTNEVFQSLVMGSKVDNYELACENLRKLRESQHSLEKIEKELVREGEKLSDMLSMPIKDALGREIEIDYSEDIANVRDILDATTARRNIFMDSIELQKLTLEQITHIHIYEKDAETTIKWIEDLYNVMIKSHTHVGCTVYEIQTQRDELQTFQETAKGTFDYCCQVLSAALALRQLCNLSIQRHTEMTEKINRIYKNLHFVSQEQMTRLRVSAVFHRSVEEHCIKLENLKSSVSSIMELHEIEDRRKLLKRYLTCREQLMVEIGRMVRLGRLLKSRLKEAFFSDEEKPNGVMSSTLSTATSSVDLNPKTTNIVPFESNNNASEAISRKLTKVSKLAEELDHILKDTQIGCTEKIEVDSSLEEKKSDELISVEDWSSCIKSSKSSTEDESFITASEITCTPQSRSSSYHTASDCRTSPWWDNERNSFDADSLDLDSQLPSFNLFNGINLINSTNVSYEDSDHSSLSLTNQNQKSSPLLSCDSIDESEKKLLFVSSSSTDNLSTDSLSSIKDGQHLHSDNELLDSSNQSTNESDDNLIHLPSTLKHNNEEDDDGVQVRLEVVAKNNKINLNNDLNSDSSVWNGYYHNIIAKQTILKGCF